MKCLLCGKISKSQFCDDYKKSNAYEIERYEKYYILQIVLLTLPIILVVPMIYFNDYILLILSVFCLLEGISLYILPYSIPDTIKAIGFKRDTIINKKNSNIIDSYWNFIYICICSLKNLSQYLDQYKVDHTYRLMKSGMGVDSVCVMAVATDIQRH